MATKKGTTTGGGATAGATRTATKAGASRTRSRSSSKAGATGGSPPPVETLANNTNRPFDADTTGDTTANDNRTLGQLRAERDRLDEILRAAEDAPKEDSGKTHFHHWIPPGQ